MIETTSTAHVPFGGKGFKIGIIGAALITVGGLILWFIQLSEGLVLSNMRNASSWGLYITNFMFFVGLSAGGLIISSAPKVFGLKGFGGISKIAIWTSICCTIVAVAFVVVDLGQPLRLWELLAYSNLSSPLMWDIIVLSIYLIISVVYLWALVRTEKGKGSQKSLRVLSVIALIVAISVHSVTAWIFGLQQGREMWNTALLAPWFVSSALVCGLALVLGISVALRKVGYSALTQENIIKMVKLLGVFVSVDLYFFACDLLTLVFPGGKGAAVVEMLTSGALAPFFWIQIVGSIFALCVAFVPRFRTTPLVVSASVVSIIAILCKRIQILVGGFQIANITYPGITLNAPFSDAGAASASLMPALIYFPSPLELGVSLGVFGLGTLLLLLGLRYLPLRPVDASE